MNEDQWIFILVHLGDGGGGKARSELQDTEVTWERAPTLQRWRDERDEREGVEK